MKIMKYKYFNMSLLILVIVIYPFNYLFSQSTIVTHDFNNGILAPFETCNVKSPNYVRVENGRVKTFWGSDGYDGSRNDKGAEFCGHELGDWLTYKEGWCGVTIELGSDYPKDKDAGIAQIMGRFLDIEWSTWSGEISIKNGDLVVSHRFGAGSSNTVYATIFPDFPYEEEVDLIIHFILSDQNKGELEFWVNGVSHYKASNINFGLGEFENDEQVPGLSRSIFKLGQYNYQDNDYDVNETRTVYYDNVTWYSGGSDGYDIVDPSGGENTCGNIFLEVPTNSEKYCENYGCDLKTATEGGYYMGGIQAGDYLSYGTFDFDTNTVNSIEATIGKSSIKDTFIEVRLDNPTGTLIGVIDATQITDGSQNWTTLQAPITNVSGEHQVFLVFTGQEGVTLVNFNWFKFSETLLTLSTNETNLISSEVKIFPNPFTNTFNIHFKDSKNTTVQLSNSLGQLILNKNYIGQDIEINLGDKKNDFYILKLITDDRVITKKMITTKN